MAKVLDSKIPAGPVPEKWKEYKAHQRLVNPKNKLKLDVLVPVWLVLQLLLHSVRWAST